MIDPMDGTQIDAMIAEGGKITRETIERHKPVAIVAAFSGGDDSIVSTHFAMANNPGCVVFNADTLVGLAPTRHHIMRTCDRFGWDLDQRRAHAEGPSNTWEGEWAEGASAYEEFCLNHGFPGSGKSQHARMYQRLKERPLRRLIRDLKVGRRGSKVVIISGIRGDESAIRAGYKRAESVSDDQVWVNPFYWRTALDFEAYRQEFGLPRNPVKRQCGISGECCCGTFSGSSLGSHTAERAAYRVADPTFAGYLDNLEARVRSNGFPWGWGESPPKWWKDARRGQSFLFDAFGDEGSSFQPMCVGCERGNR